MLRLLLLLQHCKKSQISLRKSKDWSFCEESHETVIIISTPQADLLLQRGKQKTQMGTVVTCTIQYTKENLFVLLPACIVSRWTYGRRFCKYLVQLVYFDRVTTCDCPGRSRNVRVSSISVIWFQFFAVNNTPSHLPNKLLLCSEEFYYFLCFGVRRIWSCQTDTDSNQT